VLAWRVALFALAGLVFGSFLTVLVHRLPRKEGVVRGRSRCPRCGAEIRARDNIPVISWVLLRGRCRACGEPISPEYPLTELATAALFAGAALAFEDLLLSALVAPFLGLMLAVGLIDARWRIVPNAIMYPALVIYLVALGVADLAGGGVSLPRALLGSLLYAGPLFLVALAVPGGMGMGDVKLAALIGLVLGSIDLSYVGVAAAVGIIGGGVGAILALVVLGYRRRQHIPFGPFLAVGAIVAAFAAPAISSLYLSLLGL
jgi:leader peptidase (prepilin peptidase) / N-methyltransferase